MASPNAHLTLSSEGSDKIKEWESGSAKRPHLKAYDDGTGTWTIGWGCTEGVTKGMTCTVKQAEALFDAEIAKFIDAVHRLIKREISQGLFDALVAFFYNNGWGRCPSLIRAVNSGTDAKIRAAFMLYVNAYDARLKKKVVWRGLVSRRQKELAWWAERDALEVEEPAVAVLPPAVEPSSIPVALKSKSVWALINAQILLGAGFLTNWGSQVMDYAGQVVGVAPEVTTEVLGFATEAKSMSLLVGFDWQKVSITVVVVCASVAIFRHINDKRLIS